VSPGERWPPGDAIVLREVWRGRVWTGRPASVVVDSAGLVMLFVPAGVTWFAPVAVADGRPLQVPTEPWTLRRRTWDRTNVLSFAEPGRPHAALAFWSADWAFEGWYVNVQTPLERTAAGFDYMDQELDVVIEPDRSAWRWKDEDEAELAVRLGHFAREDLERFRTEARAWTERIVRGAPPFDRDWPAWRPEPGLGLPRLPLGWDRLGSSPA
jgi:predicted RNA-binding protein associated with RNAse of E/G family